MNGKNSRPVLGLTCYEMFYLLNPNGLNYWKNE